MITYKALVRNVSCYAARSYAPCSGDMASKTFDCKQKGLPGMICATGRQL
jgi:hypothetical protein